MKKHTITLLTVVCCLVGTLLNAYSTEKALRLGTIQFPSSISRIPSMRIYYSGNKIPTVSDNEGKKITFSLNANVQKIHVVITPNISFHTSPHDTNIIDFLKADADYKYWVMTLDKKACKKDSIIALVEPIEYEWTTKVDQLVDGRIPDEAIIICYDPTYINGVIGNGSSFELPTIQIQDNVLQLAGSESQLQDISAKLLLSCIDFDTIHTAIRREVKHQGHPKIILALDMN